MQQGGLRLPNSNSTSQKVSIMALLEMKNITKKFGDVVALNNISISLEKAEILSL